MQRDELERCIKNTIWKELLYTNNSIVLLPFELDRIVRSIIGLIDDYNDELRQDYSLYKQFYQDHIHCD